MHRRWSRHSYPVQSSPVDKLPGWDAIPVAEEKVSPVQQLPKTIRAVQNGPDFHPRGRTIVVCLDGTGDKFDADNSNIVHLVSCLKKDDSSQVTYYQSGIGTYDGGGLSNGVRAAVDMAVGSGLGVHVRDAYHFLMQTYREGDKICLFGFSRGAYTARCLAGMLHKVGLLPAHNVAQVPFAYKFYANDSDEGWKMSAEFKKTFCIDCHVHFVGVFDCVASVGFIPRKLPFSSTPTSRTGHFRHAMALDEHRAKFKVCHWNKKFASMKDKKGSKTSQPSNASRKLSAKTNGSSVTSSPPSWDEKKQQDPVESEYERRMRVDATGKQTDVQEVWFMGAHADVGGGAVKNEERHKLSQIPLRWMIRQTFECNTTILFNTAALADIGLDVHTLCPVYSKLTKPLVGPSPSLMEKYERKILPPISHRSSALEPQDEHKNGLYNIKIFDEEAKFQSSGAWVPEQVEDHFDSLAGINDQLVQAKGWWVLEYWPCKYRVQNNDDDTWKKVTGVNRGRFRAVQEAEPVMHWTVHHRLRDKTYTMRGRVGRDAYWKICV